MRITDIIFALVCGRVVGFLVSDFLKGWGVHVGFWYEVVIWLVLPFVSLFCLWVAFLIGKKFLFVFQAAKFLLVGAVATIVDLKLFEWLVVAFFLYYLVAKSISFIVATALKYWGNKYWAFLKHEKEHVGKEVAQFFVITLIGLVIDVSVFYYATKIASSQFSIPPALWIKVSVIIAACASAVWSFLGYKFFVFKK
jgi:putative flippase GtrA